MLMNKKNNKKTITKKTVDHNDEIEEHERGSNSKSIIQS
jgi:hypothetical protein